MLVWGCGKHGELATQDGQDGRAAQSTPSFIHNANGEIITDIRMVSAGPQHALMLRADGAVLAWGWNVHGQVLPPPVEEGERDAFFQRPVIHPVLARYDDGKAIENAFFVAAGWNQSFALVREPGSEERALGWEDNRQFNAHAHKGRVQAYSLPGPEPRYQA